MTALYTPLNADTPNGTQTPAAFATSALANVRALRDAAVCGYVPGFAYAISGGTAWAPQYRVWLNAVTGVRFRVLHTYDVTYTYLPTTLRWEWSDDAGATWDELNTATPDITLTWAFSGPDGGWIITAADRDSGAWVLALSGLVNSIYVRQYAGTHVAVTTGAHGTGTVALQNANAVAFTGGTMKGVAIGGTAGGEASNAHLTYGNEKVTALGAIAGGGTLTMDASAGSIFTATAPVGTANFTIQVTNIPNAGFGRTIRLYLTNGGRSTGVITWSALRFANGVKPTLTAAGVDIISFDLPGDGTAHGALSSKDTKL